jgi:hypothetical protein
MAIQALFSKYDAHKVSFGFLVTKYMEDVKSYKKKTPECVNCCVYQKDLISN